MNIDVLLIKLIRQYFSSWKRNLFNLFYSMLRLKNEKMGVFEYLMDLRTHIKHYDLLSKNCNL